MMHLNFDKKTNQRLFKNIFAIFVVVINENGHTEHIVKLLKSPADASLDEYS